MLFKNSGAEAGKWPFGKPPYKSEDQHQWHTNRENEATIEHPIRDEKQGWTSSQTKHQHHRTLDTRTVELWRAMLLDGLVDDELLERFHRFEDEVERPGGN